MSGCEHSDNGFDQGAGGDLQYGDLRELRYSAVFVESGDRIETGGDRSFADGMFGMKNDKQQDLEYGEVAIMSFTLPASKAENFLDLVNQHNNHIRELLQMEDEGLSAGDETKLQKDRLLKYLKGGK